VKHAIKGLAAAVLLLGAGTAFAADAMCACCEKMKPGEKMECCDKMKSNPEPSPSQSAPKPQPQTPHQH
jgi:hypothetical protein